MPDIEKLKDKVAIVTGAAQGLGEEIAIEFGRQGARIILIDINEKEAKRVENLLHKKDVYVDAFIMDVCNSKDVNKAIDIIAKKYKKIDILVNAVGGFDKLDSIEQIDDKEWDKVIDLNLNSAFYCTRAVFPFMKKNGFGRIINISSGAGLAPNPYAPSYIPYGAAKAGLLGMTKLLARDAGEFGITVNALAPGTALTPRVKKVRDAKSIENIAKMNPMRNLIDPIDCAKAALFLASEDARYVTGVTMMVNAGNLIF
jgi:3-oxoacyl-[acyl-carrier protein] reductase